MNRSRLSLLAPLLAVLALLLGLAQSASAAFNAAATDPHYGNFLLQPSEAPARMPLENADSSREIGVWLYDSTLGVPVYVRQNPWSAFDPLGLDMQGAANAADNMIRAVERFDGLEAAYQGIGVVLELAGAAFNGATGKDNAGQKVGNFVGGMNPVAVVGEAAMELDEKGITMAAVVGVVIDGATRKIPGMKGKGDNIGRVIKEQSGEVFDSARKTVRRFMGKKEMKQLKKEGVLFDPKSSGIPTTTTKFDPKNQDVARGKTGAPTAEYRADIDVTGLPQGPTTQTRSGLPEYPIQGDLTPERVVEIKKVPKK